MPNRRDPTHHPPYNTPLSKLVTVLTSWKPRGPKGGGYLRFVSRRKATSPPTAKGHYRRIVPRARRGDMFVVSQVMPLRYPATARNAGPVVVQLPAAGRLVLRAIRKLSPVGGLEISQRHTKCIVQEAGARGGLLSGGATQTKLPAYPQALACK